MVKETFNTLNIEVQIMLVVKLQQLHREELATLTYQNLEDYVNLSLWKGRSPDALHQAAEDIMSITASDIVKFLSRQAITKSSQKSLAEFSDLIGGE